MKRILFLAAFVFSTTIAFAQYTYTETGANGNTIVSGQYNADPGINAGDSKQTIGTKLAVVYKVGTWKYWNEAGLLISEEHYTSTGVRTGVWNTWNDNGQLTAKIDFAAGIAVYYHDNGQKAEEGGINNQMVRTGTWNGWHANGKLNYTGAYNNNGAKIGTWKFYDNAGNSIGTENH
jgi:antitoxin component YwqK of YwqJK toxin-antitoxin module